MTFHLLKTEPWIFFVKGYAAPFDGRNFPPKTSFHMKKGPQRGWTNQKQVKWKVMMNVGNHPEVQGGPKKKQLPFGKLTWQWKMDLLKMYSLLNMGIFHCHVSLLEGISRLKTPLHFWRSGKLNPSYPISFRWFYLSGLQLHFISG